MMKFIKSLSKKNWLLKPASVITTVSAPLAYILNQSGSLIKEYLGEDMVVVSSQLISGLQGGIILIVIMLSIIQIYKPPKTVSISLIVGGMMMFMSSLLSTLGITLLLYGLGYLVNSFTFEKLINKNEKLKLAKEELEIERLIR